MFGIREKIICKVKAHRLVMYVVFRGRKLEARNEDL